MTLGVAGRLAPLMAQLLGTALPYRLRGWDGSEAGPAGAPATVVLRSRRALRTLLWQPDELGLARAFVAGDLDIEGDLYAALGSPVISIIRQPAVSASLRMVQTTATTKAGKVP